MVIDFTQEALWELEVARLKEQVKQLSTMLLDVLLQATGNKEGTEIDNQCETDYECACSYLARLGFLKEVTERIYRLTDEKTKTLPVS